MEQSSCVFPRYSAFSNCRQTQNAIKMLDVIAVNKLSINNHVNDASAADLSDDPNALDLIIPRTACATQVCVCMV